MLEHKSWGYVVDPGIWGKRHMVGIRVTIRAVPRIHSEGGEISEGISPSSHPLILTLPSGG